MKKPNLFIIGAPKCGTTSIHNYLSQHPEVFMSKPKEPRHFCKDFFEESDKFYEKKKHYLRFRDKESYLNLFKDVKNEKVIGESSTNYLYSIKAPEDIYKFNPNSKIIIVIREPIDFLLSYHYQIYTGGVEYIKDFKKAYLLENERKFGKKFTGLTKKPSDLDYSDKVDFKKYIKNYLKYFSKRQIKIILFDDLKNSTKNVYFDILRFLEVSDINFVPDLNNYNSSNSRQMRSINIILKKHPSMKKLIYYLFPKKVYKSCYEYIKNFKKSKKSKLDKKFEKKLKMKFHKKVDELNIFLNKEKFIKKDLNNLWRYNKI